MSDIQETCYPVRTMRLRLFLSLSLVAWLQVFCQQPTSVPSASILPKDPRAILEAARAHYNFTDPSLKPWHLKASYRLNDANGQLDQQGTWEYWWASPSVHRSSVTRQGESHSEWALANGTVYKKFDGVPLKYFERNLDTILLRQLPQQSFIEAGKSSLGLKMIGKGSSSTACVTSASLPLKPIAVQDYYCFDPTTLALIERFTDPIDYRYGQFVKMGDHYIPRQTIVTIEKRAALTISIEAIEVIDARNPAFIPATDAVLVHDAAPRGVFENSVFEQVKMFMKKMPPVYPQAAKKQRIQGAVVLGVTIGADGKIRDLEVLGSSSPLFSKSASDYVKNWEFRTFTFNGQPVEVETRIVIHYTMSG